MKNFDIEISEFSLPVTTHRWQCPECDEMVERRKAPEDLADAFCPKCYQSDARLREFMLEFHKKHNYAFDGVNVEAVPDYEYWYDYDNGSQLPVIGYRILIVGEGTLFINKSESDNGLDDDFTSDEVPF